MEWKHKIRFETSGRILHFGRAAFKREREDVNEVNEASGPSRLQKGNKKGEWNYFKSKILNTWSLHPSERFKSCTERIEITCLNSGFQDIGNKQPVE